MVNDAPARVSSAIQVYVYENSVRFHVSESLETKLYDMVADILLYAKSKGLDGLQIADYAIEAYNAEKDEVSHVIQGEVAYA